MAMLKKDLVKKRDAWSRALQSLAIELGNQHWITKGMGSVAWGRYEGEPRVSDDLGHVAMGLGYLQGIRSALLSVGQNKDLPDTEQLRYFHDRVNGVR